MSGIGFAPIISPSPSFHPQSSSQIKCKNQKMEMFLHRLSSQSTPLSRPDNWLWCTHNSHPSCATGQTPFQCSWGDYVLSIHWLLLLHLDSKPFYSSSYH